MSRPYSQASAQDWAEIQRLVRLGRPVRDQMLAGLDASGNDLTGAVIRLIVAHQDADLFFRIRLLHEAL